MSAERNPFHHDPNSMDSMFGRILERLDGMDRMNANARIEQQQANDKILEKLEDSDKRTSLLERWKDVRDARATLIGAGIAGVVSVIAWFIEHFATRGGK